MLSSADSLSVEEKRYENVYVREGRAMYYVEVPEDGRVLSFPKSEVSREGIVFTEDPAARHALHMQWKAVRRYDGDTGQKKSRAFSPSAPATARDEAPPSGRGERGIRTARLRGNASYGRTYPPAGQTAAAYGGPERQPYSGYGNQSKPSGGYGIGGAGGTSWGGPNRPMPGPVGPHFTSLVQLFSTIDDRLVGEPPAVVGIGVACIP